MNDTTNNSAAESAPSPTPAPPCPPSACPSQIKNRRSRKSRAPSSRCNFPPPTPDDPEADTLRMQHEGQPGNWLRIGHGCFMKKAHGR
jgi:hypothetical protein